MYIGTETFSQALLNVSESILAIFIDLHQTPRGKLICLLCKLGWETTGPTIQKLYRYHFSEHSANVSKE